MLKTRVEFLCVLEKRIFRRRCYCCRLSRLRCRHHDPSSDGSRSEDSLSQDDYKAVLHIKME